MKPVVIFDLDDTLIVQDLMTRRTVDFCTAFLGVDPETFWKVFQHTSQAAFEALPSYSWCRAIGISAQEGLWGDFGGASTELNALRRDIPQYRTQAWGRALQEFGFDDSELIQTIADDFASLRGRRYYAFPEAQTVLESLSPAWDFALLTNGAPELQWSKVHRCGLEAWFSSVTVSGDHGIGKPDPRIFDIVRAKHPNAPGFVMVGNSLTSDIQGARNAGLPCIWFVQGEEPVIPNVRPDAVIKNLRELPSVLTAVYSGAVPALK